MVKKRELTPIELAECAKLKEIFNNKKKELGITQAGLAEQFKISQPAVGHYLNGFNALNLQIAVKFAEALQVSVLEFSSRLAKELENMAKRLPENQQPKKLQFNDNVELYHHPIHSVPLISWVQAGEWTNVELLNPGKFEHIPTTLHLPNGFALRVRGDSMLPEFNEGDIVIVDPDCRPEHGSFVIVDNGDGASFKKLMYDGAIPYFRPLNDRFPTLTADEHTRIIGVVREKVKRY